MAYKKEHGRYARLASLWALVLLLAYGCLGSLVSSLRGWWGPFPSWGSYPVVGELDLAKLVGIGALLAGAYLLHRILNAPRSADMLIETELELRKVTWPTSKETWTGAIAVLFTVVVLLLFLWGADLLLTYFVPKLMGGAA
ncbi:MAG: preprotein translocase subunit SecE [Planctomycetes bacterium]|nr:preprotein translocase subunit SecE [Planctomycetota bacterium]